MSPDLPISRALLAAALCLLGIALWRAINWLARRNTAPGLAMLQDLRAPHAVAGPLLVYFTTPECIPCKTIQEPAIRAVQAELKDLEVIKIDATQKPHLADQWGVFSVPTTFLITTRGRVQHINRGTVRAERLLQQLAGMD